jgi:hypothetical protein
MTGTNRPTPETAARDAPGDVPASRPAALDRFDALAGTWQMEATFRADYFGPGVPEVTNRDGRTTFEWLEGKFFLVQRFANDHPAAPSGIAIIGAVVGEQEPLTQHYYDSRGVARVYFTSLENRVWKLWREAPGFWQRYIGTISDDGSRITGAWEGSADGAAWKHDFDLTYNKLNEQ